MRILQVIPFFPPAPTFGGSVRVAYDISKALIKQGHEVYVFTSDYYDLQTKFSKNFDFVEGIYVYRFKNLSYITIKNFKLYITPDLINYAKHKIKDYDVVHLHEFRTYQNYVVKKYATKYNIPFIVQAHGNLPRLGYWKKLKLLYDIFIGNDLLDSASATIALTPMEAAQYAELGMNKNKIVIIPNGIWCADYLYLPKKGEFKQAYNIPENKKLVLYFGRIHRDKGLAFLINSFANLINKQLYGDVILVIAGPDDGYLSEVKKRVNDLGISKSVLFTGPLSEERKISLYVDSYVVVYVEPFNVYGLVPLEAAACSKPVIVSKGNAISKMVENGKFGFSVDYGDISSLSLILSHLLDDEFLVDHLGKNGRQYVFKNLDWSNVIKQYETLYYRIKSL